MGINKITLMAAVLGFSCVATAYTFINQSESTTELQATVADVSSIPLISDLLDHEANLYELDFALSQQAKANLDTFATTAVAGLAPTGNSPMAIKQFMFDLDERVAQFFVLSNDAESISQALAGKRINPEAHTWLALSIARAAGLEASLVRMPGHNHVAIKSNSGWVEWRDKHAMDTNMDSTGYYGVVLDEYELWVEFDKQLVRSYLQSGMSHANDNIASLLTSLALYDEDAQAQKLYASFVGDHSSAAISMVN